MSYSETSPARLLVVEDHDLMRRSYKRFFRSEADIEVTWMVETGGEALDVLDAHHPDLVIADMSLPDMDGSDVVRRCREKDPPIPVLVVSGHNQDPVVDRSFDAGAQGYVVKGNAQQIVEGVHTILDGGRYISEELQE
jgi:DNA-binding NarL/FixJ family response regulator